LKYKPKPKHTSNYIKCKWTKTSIKKIKNLSDRIKNKIKFIIFTRETKPIKILRSRALKCRKGIMEARMMTITIAIQSCIRGFI
jgi:hypothetical protein